VVGKRRANGGKQFKIYRFKIKLTGFVEEKERIIMVIVTRPYEMENAVVDVVNEPEVVVV
jgi:hypothetical protein